MTTDAGRIGLRVKRLQARNHRAANAALAELDISLVQWDALRHLHENPEASLHDLAQLTFQSDQGFGTLAKRLVDRGLIERVPGPGRSTRHRLTARGVALQEAGAACVDEVNAIVLDRLSPAEAQIFDALLRKLLADA